MWTSCGPVLAGPLALAPVPVVAIRAGRDHEDHEDHRGHSPDPVGGLHGQLAHGQAVPAGDQALQESGEGTIKMKIKRRRPINTAAKSGLSSSFLAEGESCCLSELRQPAWLPGVWWLQTQDAGQGRMSPLPCCFFFFLTLEHTSKAHLYCCSPQNKIGF